MGTIAYNRDQRIANEIVDALLGFNDAVSLSSIYRALCAGKNAHELADYQPRARVEAVLTSLVEYGAVQKLDAIVPAVQDAREDDERDTGVPLYAIPAEVLDKVLKVARGQFQP